MFQEVNGYVIWSLGVPQPNTARAKTYSDDDCGREQNASRSPARISATHRHNHQTSPYVIFRIIGASE